CEAFALQVGIRRFEPPVSRDQFPNRVVSSGVAGQRVRAGGRAIDQGLMAMPVVPVMPMPARVGALAANSEAQYNGQKHGHPHCGSVTRGNSDLILMFRVALERMRMRGQRDSKESLGYLCVKYRRPSMGM